MRVVPKIRALRAADLDEVVRIDAAHTGEQKPDYWRRIFREFLPRRNEARGIGLGVDGGGDGEGDGDRDGEGGLAGYLFGEVRAVEFGSDSCGWVFAVGVAKPHLRGGLASALLEEAQQRFRRSGVTRIRTMVRRNDVPVLSFFRAAGFVGGPFVQLERDLEEE